MCIRDSPSPYSAISSIALEPLYLSLEPWTIPGLEERFFNETGDTLPARWFRNKARLTVGFVAKNLWMIYCKAPFDPEISAATDNAYYQVFYGMRGNFMLVL